MRQNGDRVQSGKGLFSMHLLAASAMRRKLVRRLDNVSYGTAINWKRPRNEIRGDKVRQSL
jgi:hypothetical protein